MTLWVVISVAYVATALGCWRIARTQISEEPSHVRIVVALGAAAWPGALLFALIIVAMLGTLLWVADRFLGLED